MFIKKYVFPGCLVGAMILATTATTTLLAQGSPRLVAPPQQASGSGQGGGWWQKVDASLDIATAMKEMQARGRMGLSEECDYNNFIETIKNSANSLKMVKDLDTNKAKGRWGLPTVDMFQQMLHIGEAVMTAKSALAERQGLIEHIEQVCQTSVQQDEVKRQLDMVKMAKIGTEKTVSPVLGTLNLQKARESVMHDKIERAWRVEYHEATPKGALANDTLWRGADRILLSNYQVTKEFKNRLNDLDRMLEVAATQMYIASDANGLCPNGDRAPSNADTLNLGQGIKRLACAPVSEERATQVLAQMTLLKAQAKAMRVSAMAHITQVKTVEATSSAVLGKIGQAKKGGSLATGF